MWKTLRISVLLLVLFIVAAQQLLDRVATQGWQDTLWVGVYPLNADGSAQADGYIAALTQKDFADIETFFTREGQRYGLKAEQPIHIELYPKGTRLPPALAREAGPLSIAWWSLKLRWFAMRASTFPGHAPSRIRLFVLYHDPATLDQVPDSHGLQKGLVGIVHGFADKRMTGANNMVIAHELLHTVGATDKYDLATGLPLFPAGFADRDQVPLYPQERTEIMAGRRPVSPTEAQMPRNLRSVVAGPETAAEVHWTKH